MSGRTGWLVCLLLSFGSLSAQQELSLEQARELSHSGAYQEANAAYRQLLLTEEHNLEIRLGWAFNLAWQGDWENAKIAFQGILNEWEAHPEALEGLAYVHAWAGEYGAARTRFRQILALNPDSKSARKGLAYVELWEHKAKAALHAFEELTKSYPDDAEIWMGMGQAYLENVQHQSARHAFAKADQLSNGATDGHVFVEQIQSSPSWLEVQLWGGYSQINEQNQWGLRAGQLSLHPHQKAQLWLRYDNSLSLDNADFLRRNLQSPIWYTGVLFNWSSRLTTRLELGYRMLPDLGSQLFYQGEQVVFLGTRSALKMGGFYAPRADQSREWLGYLSGFVPLNQQVALEPSYFLSQNAAGQWGHRGQLDLNYRQDKDGYRLQTGVLYGFSPQFADPGQWVRNWGLNFQAQSRLGKQHWVLLLLRYESSPLQNFFTASIGTRLRIEK